MPEETAPTDTTPEPAPAPAGPKSPSSFFGSLGCGCAALLLVPVIALVALVARASFGSTDVPRVAPAQRKK
ncbi:MULTISPECIES: hypothetical protein [Streptomyces]|uniref:hypothetical protein n=1 Tax=Streptomyces TaxID=1883 RepID=UPI0021A5182D|nr:hypothetical protein [Streptomyces atratus]MCT2545991.1 hypothetical protein [Streptomyces atratus]